MTAIAYIDGCITSTLDPPRNIPLQIFQNPFVTETQIEMDREVNNGRLEIFDMLGTRLVSLPRDSGKSLKINRGNLPTGMYAVQLRERERVIGEGSLMILNK